MTNKRTQTITNILWRFAERCGAQGVAFVVSMVLARLLAPELYGTIALVTVFTNILQVFIDGGMGSALIQKKDADNTDFSTLFFFNILMCTVLYTGMFFAAPFIADFYEDSELIPVIRVLSLTLIVSGLKNIQQAYISRTMQFKRVFFATLGGTVGAGILGIVMAYCGYGIWALVAQHLFNTVVDTLVLWITVRWRPKLIFSFERLKTLFSYGWKLLLSSLLETAYQDIRQLLIGKMYTKENLAYYNKGKQMPYLIVSNVNTAINSVLFPVLSKVQNDTERVKSMIRQSIKLSTYVMAPLMLGLAAAADNLIVLMLTEKWIESVFFVRIFCVTLLFSPIHTANLNAIKAMGRSDIFLKLEILKKAVDLTFLLASMWFGVKAMACSVLISNVAGMLINAWPNKKLLRYGYLQQLKDIMPNLMTAAVMSVPVLLIGLLKLPVFPELVIQIAAGAGIYLAISVITGNSSFRYLVDLILIRKKNTGKSGS